MPITVKSKIVFKDNTKTTEQEMRESENVTDNIAESTAVTQHIKDNALLESEARTRVDNKITEITASEETLANMYKQRDELIVDFKTKRGDTARGVEGLFDNDGTAMGELGYTVRIIGEKTPVTVCGKIINVRANQSDFNGCVKIRWKADTRRKFYKIQWTTGDPLKDDSWKNTDFSKETGEISYLIMNEQSGSRIYIRICGKNAAGQGPWSDTVNIIIP